MLRTHSRWYATAVIMAVLAVAGCGLFDDGIEDVSDVSLPRPPAGFALTPPGATLTLGETAHVATKQVASELFNKTGPTTYWAIVTRRPKVVDPSLVSSGDDVARQATKIVCFVYDVTFLGSGDDGPGDGVVIVPHLYPVGDDGGLANSAVVSNNVCDVAIDDEASSDLGRLEVGKTYPDACIGFIGKPGHEGVEPTGVAFRYGGFAGLSNKPVWWQS